MQGMGNNPSAVWQRNDIDYVVYKVFDKHNIFEILNFERILLNMLIVTKSGFVC